MATTGFYFNGKFKTRNVEKCLNNSNYYQKLDLTQISKEGMLSLYPNNLHSVIRIRVQSIHQNLLQ